MKIKILVILFLVSVIGFTLQAKSAIKDVEYLSGEDFVQLHFKTDKIIPIPDLFYPEKDNFQLIVMRIHNVAFKVPKPKLAFDSAIIKDINIVSHRKYVDVEISLKEKVNYRVFTNQNGIYIEFPNVKKIEAPAKIIKPVLEKSEKVTSQKPSPKSPETDLVKSPPYIPSTRSPNDRSELRTFRVTERSKDRIKFEFLMTDRADYKVIPIPKYPVRLAIDLINTRSRRIKENIDFLNVKTLRGAYNTPTVYRLVFDLLYLKNYSVVFNENVLEVEFFNRLKPQKNLILGLKTPANKKTEVILAKNSLPQEKVKTDNTTPVTEQQIEPRRIKNVDSVNENKIYTQKEKNTPEIGNEVLKLNIQKVNPVIDKNEFFSEEKSKVAFEGFSSTPLNEPKEKKTVSQIDSSQRTISVGEKKYSGEPMDFNFKDADLNNVLLFFAKLSGLNILIDPGVSGKVTATMFQVPWDQALEYFLKINKLDMVQEGNILRIGRVDDLAREAQQRRRLQEARQMEGKLDVWSVYLNYAEVTEVKTIVQKYLTPRGEIVTDKRTNQLIITDVPKNRGTLDKLIETLDLPTQQVSIEARIVETRTSYTQNFGIQWGYNFIADSAYGNQTSLSFPNSIGIGGNLINDPKSAGVGAGPLGGYAINLPSPSFNSGTVFSFGNVANTFRLDVALTAMEKKGKGRIISAPRTLTQNNAEATIEQGRQIPVQTIENNTVKIKYVYATLNLKVKPQITAEGMIICKLTIKNNAADFANLVNGIPPILTQELVTTVMIKDGSTLVVGGLYKINDERTRDSVPLLSKIPLLGSLFKNSLKTRDKTELLIFITPRIVK